jgi:hypothetical protein
MTRTSGRKQQETHTSLGPGWTPAFMFNVLQAKLLAWKTGAQGVKCLDHTTSSCPYRPKKRQWNNTGGSSNSPTQGRQEQQICIKYNKFNGDCKFGKECHYFHICSACKEPHPIPRCSAGKDSSDVSNQ